MTDCKIVTELRSERNKERIRLKNQNPEIRKHRIEIKKKWDIIIDSFYGLKIIMGYSIGSQR